jgi:hypothetical protein
LPVASTFEQSRNPIERLVSSIINSPARGELNFIDTDLKSFGGGRTRAVGGLTGKPDLILTEINPDSVSSVGLLLKESLGPGRLRATIARGQVDEVLIHELGHMAFGLRTGIVGHAYSDDQAVNYENHQRELKGSTLIRPNHLWGTIPLPRP